MSDFYNLIPSQDTIYLMQKYSFHKQIVQIPTSFMVDMDVDFNVLTKALNIEIERNDSMRLRFKKDGKKIVQYFLDSYKIDSVKVLTFKTEEEQEKFFAKDAKTPVRFMKDECYRIYFFNSFNGYKGIYLNASHMALDAMGILVFYLDLLAIYKSLVAGEELPEPLFKYEDYIKEEHERCANEKRFEKDKKFYDEYFRSCGEPMYCGVHGPAFLEKERIKKKNPDLKVPSAYSPLLDKAEVLKLNMSKDLTDKILVFCKERNVAPESLMLLAMRTHLSSINGREPFGMQLLMCNKRIKYKDMRTGGCMAQPLQVLTRMEENMTFTEALDEFLILLHTGAAHAGAEVGSVDEHGDIGADKGTADAVGGLTHFGVAGAVQHEIAELGVAGAGQNALGLAHGVTQRGGDKAVIILGEGLLQLFAAHTARAGDQVAGGHAGALALDDGLCVVVIVAHTEQIHQLRLGSHTGQFREDRLPTLGQGGVHTAAVQLGKIRPARFAQELCGFGKASGGEHLLKAFAGEHIGFPGAQQGGQEQIISVRKLS